MGPSRFVLCRVAGVLCRRAPEGLAEAAMGVSSKATVVAVAAMVEAVMAANMRASSTVGSTTITKRSVHGHPCLTVSPSGSRHQGLGQQGQVARGFLSCFVLQVEWKHHH